jgi:diacylglycerol kinase family enzyme
MPPRLFIIYNPAAGRARRAWPVAREALEAARASYEVRETNSPDDATRIARTALREGCEVIAALGGDGTLGETATGFFDLNNLDDNGLPSPVNARAVFAPLPAGTGNDFTRALANGKPAPLETWLATLVAHLQGKHEPRPVDTIYCATDNGARRFIALNLVSLGLSVEVIERVRAQNGWLQKLPGGARFVWGALGALRAWRERPARVTLDDEPPREFTTNLLTFANSPYAGGGMMFAPAAKLDDGRLDALLSGGLGRAEILRELPRIRSGGHVANPKVTIPQARRARVETLDTAQFTVEADSNLRGVTPLEMRVMPQSLRVLAGGPLRLATT